MSIAVRRKTNTEIEKNNTKNGLTLNFNGRLNRTQFIFGLFLVPVISWLPIFIIYAIVKFIETIFGLIIIDGFVSLLFLAIPIISSAILGSSVFFRRHHDLNQSGYIFLSIIVVLVILMLLDSQVASILSSFYSIYLLLFAGSKTSNNFGLENAHQGALQIVGLKS